MIEKSSSSVVSLFYVSILASSNEYANSWNIGDEIKHVCFRDQMMYVMRKIIESSRHNVTPSK